MWECAKVFAKLPLKHPIEGNVKESVEKRCSHFRMTCFRRVDTNLFISSNSKSGCLLMR